MHQLRILLLIELEKLSNVLCLRFNHFQEKRSKLKQRCILRIRDPSLDQDAVSRLERKVLRDVVHDYRFCQLAADS